MGGHTEVIGRLWRSTGRPAKGCEHPFRAARQRFLVRSVPGCACPDHRTAAPLEQTAPPGHRCRGCRSADSGEVLPWPAQGAKRERSVGRGDRRRCRGLVSGSRLTCRRGPDGTLVPRRAPGDRCRLDCQKGRCSLHRGAIRPGPWPRRAPILPPDGCVGRPAEPPEPMITTTSSPPAYEMDAAVVTKAPQDHRRPVSGHCGIGRPWATMSSWIRMPKERS